MLLVIVAIAFSVGMLWQKVSDLEKGGARTTGTVAQQPTTGGAAGVQPAADGKLSESQAANIPAVTDQDHTLGNLNAEVFLIEYSDFECPYCARFHPTAQQALEEYGDKIAWVYRHFPLDSIHPRAQAAAQASECIAELGGETAFWKFADEAFTQGAASLDDLPALAVAAGVNEGAFNDCFNASRYANKVDTQYQEGLKAGITGTPGNFIVNKNGDAWLIPGAIPFESLKTTIDEALGL